MSVNGGGRLAVKEADGEQRPVSCGRRTAGSVLSAVGGGRRRPVGGGFRFCAALPNDASGRSAGQMELLIITGRQRRYGGLGDMRRETGKERQD